MAGVIQYNRTKRGFQAANKSLRGHLACAGGTLGEDGAKEDRLEEKTGAVLMAFRKNAVPV